jgi:plastocyanin
MKKVILILICTICFIDTDKAISGDPPEIKGTVFMPVMAKERRTSRGRMYRNRLSSKKSKKTKSAALKSAFIDVIVSAHPVSYVFEVDTLPPVKILQIDAEFVPRVVPVTPGTRVQFINRDGFYHNVFSLTPGSRFNIGRKATGIAVSRRFYNLGEIKLFCDIHAQMNATVICLDTPYFTRVRPNGQYEISGIPEGKYEIRIYHPDLPQVSEVVDIKTGDSITKNFTLNR